MAVWVVLLVLATVGCFAGAWVLYVIGKRSEFSQLLKPLSPALSREDCLLSDHLSLDLNLTS